jgi:hypothetical protein
MGRSKSKPVQKRPRLDDQDDQAKAIAILQSVPQDQVEEAAAEATRNDVVQNWPHLVIDDQGNDGNLTTDGDDCNSPPTSKDASRPYKHTTSSIPSWARGLGSSRKIDEQHFQALQALHNAIKNQSPQWTSWSGSPSDPRQRAFGFLPGTLGYDARVRQQLDISMPWREVPQPDEGVEVGAGEEEERSRNERAIVLLETLPDGVQEAIDHVCKLFRECLVDEYNKNEENDDNSNSKREKHPQNHYPLSDFLHYKNLIAAQPNLHNGRALLPVHLDHPCKDGFGVVIVTVAMTTGAATILLQDVSGTHGLAMPLQQGQAYMLSGMARDACVHGVLADVGSEHRESLNLRFGLHDLRLLLGEAKENDVSDDNLAKLPGIPSTQVLQYWESFD